jgi:hypothetical protein
LKRKYNFYDDDSSSSSSGDDGGKNDEDENDDAEIVSPVNDKVNIKQHKPSSNINDFLRGNSNDSDE